MFRALVCAALSWLPTASLAQEAQRILSIGGATTEIVHALGQGGRLIARDSTSTYPPEVTDLPDVGYMRRLSPEGVLSLAPDLILAQEGSGPPEALEVIASAGIPVVTVPDTPSAEGILDKISVVGEALGTPDAAHALAETTAEALSTAQARADAVPEEARKRVMFVLSMQGGRVMAAGADTSAATIIDLAGGVNALADVSGYKPISDEAMLAARPDVILMMAHGGGGHQVVADQLWALPGLADSPAAQANALIRMDGLYLLGFGPRTAQAAQDLAAQLDAQ